MRQNVTAKSPQTPSDQRLATQTGRAGPLPPRTLMGHMHSQMRGRYRWLVLAGIGGLTIGAAVGFVWTQPLYRTVGLVEVEPPAGLPDPAENENSESFAERQLDLIRGPKVAAQALGSALWQSLEARRRPADVGALSERLEARPLSGEPLQILVSYSHPHADFSAVAVRSVVESFVQATAERHRAERSLQTKRIEEQLKTLRQQKDKIRSRMAQVTSDRGPIPIGRLYASKVDELSHLDSLLESTRLALETAQTDPEADLNPVRTAQILAGLAQTDANVREWLDRRQQVERKLTKLRRHMGLNAPAVVDARHDLGWIDQQIRNTIRAVGPDLDESPGSRSAANDSPVTLSIEDLRRRESHLRRRYEQSRLRVADLEEVKAQVEALEKLDRAHRLEIDQEQSHLEQWTMASEAGPRINVLSFGELPLAPYKDGRGWLATVFGGAGCVAGLCLVLIVTALDDRMLRPDNAALEGSAAPLLGSVPGVSPAGPDPQDSDLAALCIHEIRALLQVRATTNGNKAFAITSPSRGAGTTSLTVGLASSLALSGTRTLLVDCDLAGRVQSTDAAGAQGGAAAAGDDVGPGDPVPAIAASVDQVMLQMGYVNEEDASIFLNPRDTETGLLGVLSGAPLEQCVVHTNLRGLSILPALCGRAQDIGKMSSKFIRGLIDEASSMYDIILLDTGPIPGSVEALFVTSEADAVILVVRRGESQRRFDHSVSYLRMVGAEVAGSVFNGAAKQSLSLQAAGGPDGSGGADQTARRARPRELTAGSGILLAAVQDQSNPTGAARTARSQTAPYGVEQDPRESGAVATSTESTPQGPHHEPPLTKQASADLAELTRPRQAETTAPQGAAAESNHRDTRPDRESDRLVDDGSTADAVEQALDEQIRQLLADASTADDVSGAPGVRSKDRSTSETVG